MAETKIRIESIRTWPGRRVPLPPAHPEPLLLTDDGFLEIDWEREIAPGGVELPEELYLRELCDLDLDDTSALIAFLERWGRLSRRAAGDLAKTDHLLLSPFASGHEVDTDTTWGLLPRGYYFEDFKDGHGNLCQRGELAAIDKLVADYLETRPTAVQGRFKERADMRTFSHVREEVVYARLLRNAVRLWDALQGGRDLWSAFTFEWEGDLGNWITKEWPPMVGGRDEDEAHRRYAKVYLRDVLSAGLRPFHAYVDFQGLLDLDSEGPPWRASTYSLLCLQLANDISEGAVYRRCANEKCGRIFARQRGRAQKGQYRSDATFCDRSCARAQAQRDYQSRKKDNPVEPADEKP